MLLFSRASLQSLNESSLSQIEVGHLSSATEGVSNALAEGRREFRSDEGVAGQCGTLITPDFPQYGGKAVGKGEPLLVVQAL